jgi:hypothetical protein
VRERVGYKAHAEGRRKEGTREAVFTFIEVPTDVNYYVYKCPETGVESIHEKHRVWPENEMEFQI